MGMYWKSIGMDMGIVGLTSITQIQTCKQHQRLKTQHPQRPRQDNSNNMIEVRLLQLQRRNNTLVARLPPQSLSAALEDSRTVRFVEEVEERPCGACEDGADPKGPGPGDDGYEAGYWGAEDRSEGRRCLLR
jgi:hypothetical protein